MRIVAAQDAEVLALARAAACDRRVSRPLDGFPCPLDIIHRGNDNAQCTDVRGVLDVSFLHIRQADHGSSVDVWAGGDHPFDVSEFECAVLHLEPGVVVMFRRLAISRNIKLPLGKAEDLLAFQKLLLGGFVQACWGGG